MRFSNLHTALLGGICLTWFSTWVRYKTQFVKDIKSAFLELISYLLILLGPRSSRVQSNVCVSDKCNFNYFIRVHVDTTSCGSRITKLRWCGTEGSVVDRG